MCKLQASKPLASYSGRMRKKKCFSPPTQPGYEASNPLIISAKDKGSSFSQGKRTAVQLSLDCLLSRRRILNDLANLKFLVQCLLDFGVCDGRLSLFVQNGSCQICQDELCVCVCVCVWEGGRGEGGGGCTVAEVH